MRIEVIEERRLIMLTPATIQQSASSSTLKRLIVCSVLYVVWASIAAAVAIAENRAGEFAGFSTGLPALQNFLYGMGTGMSPSLLHLIVQVAFTVLAPRRDRWGGGGVVGLAIFGLFTVIGAIFEPINLELLNPVTFNLPRAVIQSGMIIIPFAMMVFGILERSRRRRER
jgi:hypothetical protein